MRRGVAIPERMKPLMERLKETEDFFLSGDIDAGVRRRLYELKEEGIIDLESGFRIKKRGVKTKYDKNHRRLTMFILGMLFASETILFSLYFTI